MARPQKNGLDYFALDVIMSDEVEVIEATYGLPGFAILIKLYQKIYSESYFLEWNEKQQILFSNRVSTDRNEVTSIVNDCIEWDIFDKEKYAKYNILTARRIQSHYFTSVYKRVNIEAIKEYLLVDVGDKENLNIISITGDNKEDKEDKEVVPDDGNEDVSVVSDVKSTQSKEDKIKEDNIKDIYDYYLSLALIKHRTYTKAMANAITKAMKENKYNVEYCKALLKRHEEVVEITKDTKYPVKIRGIDEFFGQKVSGAVHLICSEYDEGGKYYEKYIKQEDKPKEVDANKPQSIGYKGSGY